MFKYKEPEIGYDIREEDGHLEGCEWRKALQLAADLRASYEELLLFIGRNTVDSYVIGMSLDDGDINGYSNTNAKFSFRKKDHTLIVREQIENEIATYNIKGTTIFSNLSEFELTPYGHTQEDENRLIWML